MEARNYDEAAIDDVKATQEDHKEVTEEEQVQRIKTGIRERYKTTERDKVEQGLIADDIPFTAHAVDVAIAQYNSEEAEKARKAAEAAKAAEDLKKAEAEKAAKDAAGHVAGDRKTKDDVAGHAAGDLAPTPANLHEIVNTMWTLSAWRQGWRYVSENIKATYNVPLLKLSERVYKAYTDSDGDPKALGTLLASLPKPPQDAAALPTTPLQAAQNVAGAPQNPLQTPQSPPQPPNLNTNQPPNPNTVPNSVTSTQANNQCNPLLQWVTALDLEDAQWLNMLFHDPEHATPRQ